MKPATRHLRPIGSAPAAPSGRSSATKPVPLADSSAVLRCFTDRKPELDWVWKDLWKAVEDLYRYDADLFIAKTYGNGRAVDDAAAYVFNVTKLEEYIPTVLTKTEE